MSAAVKKLDGVESVDVSLEQGSVDTSLKADNKITLPQLRRIIRSNGNETKDAKIAGRARVVDRDGTPVLDLLNGDAMEVESAPKAAPGSIVDITGVSNERARNIERVTLTKVK